MANAWGNSWGGDTGAWLTAWGANGFASVVNCTNATGTLQQSNDDTGNAYGLGGTLDRFGQFWASGSTLKPATVTGACFRLRKIGTPTGTIKLIVENSETEEADPADAEGTEYDLSGITGIATDYFFDLGQTFVVSSAALYVALEVSGTFDGGNYIEVTGGSGNNYDGTDSNARGVAFPSSVIPTSADTWFQVYGTQPVTEDPITSIDFGTRLVVTISNTLSADETDALKVDVSQLSPEEGTGRPVREVYIEQIKAITSGVDVDILWDATSPEHCLSLSGDSGIDWDFRAVGPLTNNAGAGKTGNILFSTNGATTGSSYSVTLVMRKKY